MMCLAVLTERRSVIDRGHTQAVFTLRTTSDDTTTPDNVVRHRATIDAEIEPMSYYVVRSVNRFKSTTKSTLYMSSRGEKTLTLQPSCRRSNFTLSPNGSLKSQLVSG